MRLPPHSEPLYETQHSGPVFICGNAWCLHDDLARARAIYGADVPVIAINGASREVKAFALFSIHTDRFVKDEFRWIHHQRRLFGDGFTVHGSPKRRDHPWVDHWWHGARKGGGSSSWCARRVAGWMGFEPVVLCGAPLVAGNYAGQRPGLMMTKPNVIERYRIQVEADTEWHMGAVSMSGWTRELLGGP